MEQYDAALADFNRAIELNPKYDKVITQRGETYRLMKQYDAALADFNRAIELDTKYAWAIARRGQTYQAMEQYDAALADFNQALKIDDKSDWDFYCRGTIHLKLRQRVKAKKDFEVAIELAQQDYDKDPKNWQNTLNLALYHLVSGAEEKAKPYFEQTLTNKANKYFLQGCIRDLDDFLLLFPNHKQAKAARHRLTKALKSQ
jgi:tetratricopeptide (TPR) repeat protein